VQPEVKAGSPVKLTVVLTNESNKKMSGSKGFKKGLDLAYRYEIRDTNGDVLTSKYHPDRRVPLEQRTLIRLLEPGQSVKDVIEVNEMYDLSRPGTYTIQLSRQVDGRGLDVKSNKIVVTVLPTEVGKATR